MAINKNWHRWIYSSIAKYFNDNKGEYSLLVEGQDRLPENLTERAELRMNGPFFNEQSKDQWVIDIDINLLLNISLNDEDMYRSHRIIGYFLSVFPTSIAVFRFGDTADDDDSYLGCLVLKSFRGDDITVTNYGQVSLDTRIVQTTIDGVYRMELP